MDVITEPVTTKKNPRITIKFSGSGFSIVVGTIWTKNNVINGVVAKIALTLDASICVRNSLKNFHKQSMYLIHKRVLMTTGKYSGSAVHRMMR